ncbi:hypothetical protein EP1X_01265 [Thermococcus sp. EP1]|uniref:hypothetical protein n=1 Tax=Thermococcus sp. EP1 TaxID=1591054 RepID=UPI0006DBA9C0|nr:hypothetical protein [Thermococcus sp. EP1]KPU63857.1 hypothetical protein EP1X_01265 [Thermococcus sp. EP1]
MSNDILWRSVNSLYLWVQKEKHQGWDPYDGLSGEVTQKVANKKWLSILILQLNLYSPVNLRPMFRIKKGCANKARALFSRAYLNLYSLTGDKNFKIEAKTILKKLETQNLSKNKDEFCCASYYFPYIAPKHYLGPSLPDIICVTESAKSFIQGYAILKKKKYLLLANKAVKFLLNKLVGSFEEEVYFKYTPLERGKIVFNVSALALETISALLRYSGNESLLEIGQDVVKLLIKHQRVDGAWPYSIHTNSRMYYWQIDYHQGFIIDGLLEFFPYITHGKLRDQTKYAIHKAITFYMKKQFTLEGASYYRYPIKYPIDIHNQAQGIITFSRLYSRTGDKKYLKFAQKIAQWTIKNMQSQEGYFYTHKWPGFVNKTPHMRWGQAWMILALSTLLSMGGTQNESHYDWPN